MKRFRKRRVTKRVWVKAEDMRCLAASGSIGYLDYDQVGSPTFERTVTLFVASLAGYVSKLTLRSESPAGKYAYIYLITKSGSTEKSIEIANNGSSVDFTVPGHILCDDLQIGEDCLFYRDSANVIKTDDQLNVVGDIRTSGGISSGSLTTDPSAGEVVATKQLKTDEYVTAKEQSSAPSALSGYGISYALDDSFPYYMRDDSVEIPLFQSHIPMNVLGGHLTDNASMGGYKSGRVGVELPTNLKAGVQFTFYVPPGWAGLTIYLDWWWLPDTAAAGNVYWQHRFSSLTDGSVPTAWADAQLILTTATPGVQDEVVKSTQSVVDTYLSEGQALEIEVFRKGTDALDTYGDSVWLCAAVLRVT